MRKKVAVIGAGIGGIALASRLAVKGYHVDVFEKNDIPGGKLSEIRHEGYRFDTGPSLFTLPGLITELFELAGEDAGSHFAFMKLPEICRYFYEDGKTVRGYENVDLFARELEDKMGELPKKVRAYLEESRKIYELTSPVFIGQSLHLFKNYLSADILKAIFNVHKIRPFDNLHKINSRFFNHPDTIQLFDRFATYNGSDPYRCPATLMVIPHLEHNTGAYFPAEGMYGIVRSLVSFCERMGVDFHYNSPVDEIMVRNDKVYGIRVNKSELIDYELVVSDIDIWYLYKNLLKSTTFPGKWFRHERSTSALIFYWGMETESPMLDLHNILFSGDYKQEFNCLFNMKTIYSDPTVYIFISSKVVQGDSPSGCENWFVMINTPENIGQDWDGMIADARCRIEEKIKKLTGIEVGKYRKFEFLLDPWGIEQRTASFRGSLYGNSSNSMWAAFRRHPNFSKIKGLYMTGGSVHPGGGIPLCLQSAKIVSEIITNSKN